MKTGIVADIHENADGLRSAIQHLRNRDADRIILLGDVAETGARLPKRWSY